TFLHTGIGAGFESSTPLLHSSQFQYDRLVIWLRAGEQQLGFAPAAKYTVLQVAGVTRCRFSIGR
ncbi:hypothetical protein BDZ89DRAFT_1071329, partial [Hymenopellis radicata]